MAKKTITAEPSREVPYDIDMEQALLGAILNDQHSLDLVGPTLKPNFFYDPLHQRLAAMALQMWASGRMVSPLTLKAMMENDAGLAELGGLPYLISLSRAAPGLPNVREYTRVLADFETRRELIRIGEDTIAAAFEPPPLEEINCAGAKIAAWAGERLFRAGRQSDSRMPMNAADAAYELLVETDAVLAGTIKLRRVPTGLNKLDNETGGLIGGDFTSVPGRSGMGKSALLGGIAVRAALAGYPVLVFSLEMMRKQWMARTLCDLDFDSLGADTKPMYYNRFHKGTATAEDLDRAVRANTRLQNLKFKVLDDDRLTVEDIAGLSRSFATDNADAECGLIVIDYLQIISPSNMNRRDTSREQEVSHAARGCKALAKLLGWAVVAGVQLKRNTDERNEQNRRPQVADIRESGAIENESDLIIAPYRKAHYLETRRPDTGVNSPEYEAWRSELDQCRNDFELIGLKSRHGAKFTVDLWADMGASAVRDFKPIPGASRVAQELLNL